MDPVLVVDDSEDIRLVVRDFLAGEGYRVLEAGDGVAALTILQHSPQPMLVLLDDRLPSLSGTDVLQRVVAKPELLRHAYTLMTARDPRVPETAFPFAVEVLRKPFDLDDLLARIDGMAQRLVQGASS